MFIVYCPLLERFQRMELEKKKQRTDKTRAVPVVRYHSFSVPNMLVNDNVNEEDKEKDPIIRFGKYERTLLSFTRDSDFKEVFSKFKRSRATSAPRRCVISGYVNVIFQLLIIIVRCF